jgi:hypothetical protein
MISSDLGGYFVSPSGNDANPGTLRQPWKTIGKAAQMAHAGDTVYLREGIYHETVSFESSGTENNPIQIKAYPGENPVIDGQNRIPGPGGSLLNIIGDYIYASGIEVRNSANLGILVYGNYDVVNNLFVHHSIRGGILINHGHHSTVQNCHVWRNSLVNEYGKADNYATGLAAARDGVSYATIRHNTVWENWGQGINTYEADHTLIEGNIIHDSFSTNIYIHDSTHVLCQRNLVYANPTSYIYPYGDKIGIMMGDERNSPPSADITIINNISFGNNWNYALFKGTSVINNILIANNTFVNANTGGVLLRGYHQNVRFENNIVQQDGPLPGIVITLDPDVSFSNNLWSKTPPITASGPGDVIGDPLLAKAGEPYAPEWFRLTALSPAIDRARSIPEIVDDFFGNLRGVFPDIGAVEYTD